MNKFSLPKVTAIVMFSLWSLVANAQDKNISQQNAELETLKASVVTKENEVAQSQSELDAQSATLECLSDLLKRYADCEKDQAQAADPAALTACLGKQKAMVQDCNDATSELSDLL